MWTTDELSGCELVDRDDGVEVVMWIDGLVGAEVWDGVVRASACGAGSGDGLPGD
ncbi:MAG TPA: hypothetical protein VIH85_21115 [Solirubrobacteraceae bacterium]